MNKASLYDLWNSLGEKASKECINKNQFIYAQFLSCSFGNTYISTNLNKDKALILNLPHYPDEISFPNIKGLDFEITNIPSINDKKVFLVVIKVIGAIGAIVAIGAIKVPSLWLFGRGKQGRHRARRGRRGGRTCT